MSDAPPTAPADPTPIKVDRQRTTPFLLKLFYRQSAFHRLDDFKSTSQPRDHIQIYTWRDCTLQELAILLSDALPQVCPARSRCGFRLIYADTRYGQVRYTSKDLGAVVPADPAADGVARKTLGEVQFVVGDWIDVAVYPEGHGGVGAVRGFAGGRGGMGAGRENGFGGFKVRGGARAAYNDRGGVMPQGEWRRGELVDDGGAPVGPGGDAPGRGGGMGMGRGGGFRRGGGGGGRRYRD